MDAHRAPGDGLSAEERREIDAELAAAERPEAAYLDALKIVQRHRRWVSDAALLALAEHLEVAPERLEALATFYNLIFRCPVGRHVILLCDSVACWMLGAERLREHLRARLGIGPGETTADDRFTLLTNPCLGACDRAPAMWVDGDLHTELTEERIDAILESYA
jgi:NADH-quinone oxidoreductase subunit E